MTSLLFFVALQRRRRNVADDGRDVEESKRAVVDRNVDPVKGKTSEKDFSGRKVS